MFFSEKFVSLHLVMKTIFYDHFGERIGFFIVLI